MGKSRNDLTYEYVNSRLRYEPETGLFFWKEKPPVAGESKTESRCRKTWNTRYAEKEAGCEHRVGRNSYEVIRIDDTLYRAHRIAWLLHYGEWPKDQVDHINGNGLDNRIENLRDVTNQENHKNRSLNSNNSSGVTGVWFHKQVQKWAAEIKIDGKKRCLGLFADINAAARARKEAERKYSFHKNHGRAA